LDLPLSAMWKKFKRKIGLGGGQETRSENKEEEKKWEQPKASESPKKRTGSSKGYFANRKQYKASLERAKGTKLLNLSDCGLKNVPNEINGIPLLTSIDFSSNQLTRVELPTLEKLKILNISSNNITEIADCFDGMRRLDTLNIANNRLTSVPDSIWGLPRLKTLNLSHNGISIFQSSKLPNSSVQNLDLSHNGIQVIAKEVLEMPKLYELKVSYNRISSLPDDWKSAQKLSIVEFEGNMIDKIGPSMFADTQIFRINVAKNPCHPDRWRLFEGFELYVKRYKSHADKGLYHGAKVDYDKFV